VSAPLVNDRKSVAAAKKQAAAEAKILRGLQPKSPKASKGERSDAANIPMANTASKESMFTFGGAGKKAKPLILAQSLRTLAMILKVGESEARALEVVGYEFRKYDVGRAYTTAAEAMRVNGATFKDAMVGQFVFPRTVRELVDAAPTSQSIHGALVRSARLISQSQNVKKKMLTALIQPGFMMGLCLVFMFAATAFIIPGFIATFAALGTETPPIVGIVLTVSEVVKWVMGFLIGLTVLGALFWVFYGRRSLPVIRFMDGLSVRVPVIRPIVQLAATSRLFELLTANLVTGRGETVSLESASAGCGNEAIHAHCVAHADRMRAGNARMGEFARSTLFPSTAQSMLASAPSVKQQMEIMNELAPEYRTEADNRLETFSKTIEPLVNYLVYGVAGTLIVAIVVPMYAMFPALMNFDTGGTGGAEPGLPPMG
jgi:type IV pilus assembly protein PilC